MSKIEPMLKEMGIDPVPVFESAGFRPEDFRDPDHFLPFVKASYLLERCCVATSCDHFGFLLGQRVRVSDFGLVGFMVRSADTVGRALQILLEFLDLFDDAGYLTLDIGDNTAVMGYTLFEPGVRAADQIYDMSMTVMANTMRALCGESWRPTEVVLPREKPASAASYQRYFRAPVRFGAHVTAIAFSGKWLDHQPPAADEMLFGYLKSEADEIHRNSNASAMNKLPLVISQGLMQGRFLARQVAENLGMHERTLQRLLAESGTTYRHQLGTIRFSLAQQLLEVTTMTISEIAVATGYNSSSAFIRAFERWTKFSPGAWRKLHKRSPRTRG